MIDAELDLCPAYGWQTMVNFSTHVVALRNGHERRNQNWAQMKHGFVLPFQNITDSAYLIDLKAVFVAAGGQTESFLAKDNSDFEAANEPLGNAPSGSTPVQLSKSYAFGATTVVRPITRPISASVKQNGSPKAGTFDPTTGLFTPSTAWSAGQPLTWSGEFRVPVRFASDSLQMSIDSRSGEVFLMNGSVELIEVFGE
jgi:uncharacterized protein (TIGR02217 family)